MSEEKLTLKVNKREISGKKVKVLREQGLIPSVIATNQKGDILTQSDYVETEKVIRKAGYHSPIFLDVDGKKQMVLVNDVSFDPVKRTIINIEFKGIKATEVVEATAPIVVVNFEESEAAKAGLSRTLVMDEIDVKAKPADLPSSLEIDASGLVDAESRLTVADIKLPENVEFADKEQDMDELVVTVFDAEAEAAAREAKEAAEAAEQAEAETAEAEAAEGGEGASEEKAEGEEKTE